MTLTDLAVVGFGIGLLVLAVWAVTVFALAAVTIIRAVRLQWQHRHGEDWTSEGNIRP